MKALYGILSKKKGLLVSRKNEQITHRKIPNTKNVKKNEPYNKFKRSCNNWNVLIGGRNYYYQNKLLKKITIMHTSKKIKGKYLRYGIRSKKEKF